MYDRESVQTNEPLIGPIHKIYANPEIRDFCKLGTARTMAMIATTIRDANVTEFDADHHGPHTAVQTRRTHRQLPTGGGDHTEKVSQLEYLSDRMIHFDYEKHLCVRTRS